MVGAVVTELNTGRSIRHIAKVLRFEPATRSPWRKIAFIVGLICLISHVGSRKRILSVLTNAFIVNTLSGSCDMLMYIVPADAVQRQHQWISTDTRQAQVGKSSQHQRRVDHRVADNNFSDRASVSRDIGTTIWLRNSPVDSTHGAPEVIPRALDLSRLHIIQAMDFIENSSNHIEC